MLRFFLLFFVFIFSIKVTVSQAVSDNTLLKNASFEKKEYQKRVVVYGFSQNKKKTINPIYHLLSGSMYLYQSLISPQLSTRCAYNPSCSAYSKELIKEYGFIKGIFCSSDRLMRCNRIALADVPPISVNHQDGKICEHIDRYDFRHKKKHNHSSKTKE